ncbi:uncharacterized protein PRCAT00001001001 [Priceomyces carsonii]|uniref:uncharacterized protein n=1 Tax=Priceomyces carsonii TaxID=28549 RepID=UPI002ED82BE2|nr:unnamed protein product [Priceomyces carsonii]
MSNNTLSDGVLHNVKSDSFYGVLKTRNIKRVQLGDYEFDTWYGNAAYFMPLNHTMLGFEYRNLLLKKNELSIKGLSKSSGLEVAAEGFWIDTLYVCEYCLKYSSESSSMEKHRVVCQMKSPNPQIGKLLYRDEISPYLIRKIRGFEGRRFCQNLSLFSKLFLDDKSVYYDVDYFDFYVIYGKEELRGSKESNNDYFKPMGFFSKEVLSWDVDNNLACICVFPPYQRRHLGSLLIEFSYVLAQEVSRQARSGPELPLSPYGKVTYLKFWSKKLAYVIASNYGKGDSFTLDNLADETGFRKEDLLMTLEYMKLLKRDSVTGDVLLLLGNLEQWCKQNGVDSNQDKGMLNPKYLVL